MSYVTRQRTREIGTRTALGATSRDVIWLVMRQAGAIAAAGLAVGMTVGILVVRLTGIRSLLYDTAAWDPITLAVAPTTLLLAALAACYLPARRAARIDPARTLAES